MTAAPTREQTTAYQTMFDHFNRELFRGELAPVLLNFSRHKGSLGFFAPNRWGRQGEEQTTTHEISLNPGWIGRPFNEVAGTLVHEMVHEWQQQFGEPSRTGYHNREWAQKMVAVGLQPSATGQPGGAIVGQRMTHYPIPGGPFHRALATMPESARLPWRAISEDEQGKTKDPRKQKVAYACGGCGMKVWGKPELNVWCGDCEQELTPGD